MSKTLLGVVVAILALIGGYFALGLNKEQTPEVEEKTVVQEETKNTNEEATETTSDEPEITVSTTEQPSSKKMAFNEFIKNGGSYKCEVKQALSDMDNSGTVYIDGERIRGDFTTIAEGRKMDTSFIFREGYSYTWSSALPNTGFKMKVEKTATGDTKADTSGTYSWNAEQIGDYNCVAWTVGLDKFALPRGVTFNEVGAQ